MRKLASDDDSATAETASGDGYLFDVTSKDTDGVEGAVGRVPGANQARIDVTVSGLPVSMVIDSGASSNLVGQETGRRLEARGVRLQATKKRLYAYGGRECLPLLGEMHVSLKVNDGPVCDTIVYVYDGTAEALLGLESACALGVLEVHGGNTCNAVQGSISKYMGEYPQVFQGVGKLKNETIRLHVDPDVKPVAQPCRKIPFGYRDLVKDELDRLLTNDIIERVEGGPTRWVSPLVVVPKNEGRDVRICVDMRQANKAVERARHPIPTAKELLYKLNGAKIFSKVDLRLGFHQCELDEASRDITTFVTPFGLFRYKRLSLGVSSAPEVYQHTIQKVLLGLEGTFNYADDIIVCGGTQEEHDKRLRALFQRLEERGLTLNPNKCELGLEQVTYLGYTVSARGVAPDARKVEAVVQAREPTNVAEVRGFMGLVQFMGVFVKDLATLGEPIWRLVRKGVAFKWGPEQAKAFAAIKESLADCQTLAFFDPNCTTRVVADAGPAGLGAVLCQVQDEVERVVAYGHRSLTEVERRYSQTEKEALSLVWACEHFMMYLLGIQFELVTDHKPLQFIFNRADSKPSPRIERWVLRLMAFNYVVVHLPGAQNIADPLSRLCVTQGREESHTSRVAEEYVRMVAESSVPVALTWREVVAEAKNCQETQVVLGAMLSGDWSGCSVAVRAVHEELCECDGVVLRGRRIMVPTALRTAVLMLGHEGHQGIAKTKQRLRQKVWWPGMDRDAERVCKACLPCQCVGPPPGVEPIVSTRLPERPWEVLAIDIMGPLPSGDSIVVLVDYYSRYYEVGCMRSPTADKIVEFCQAMCARWGIPKAVRTDNGPQFTSKVFQEYLSTQGTQWISTTPLWPQANGEVERQNRSLLKVLRVAALEGKGWKQELQAFLLAYRSTPHSATGVAPFELMTGRSMRTKLPQVDGVGVSVGLDDGVRERDAVTKLRAKEAADVRRGAKPSPLEVGDAVLVPSPKVDKLSPNFSPVPYKVVARHGSEATCQSPEGRLLRRNVSMFKPVTGATHINDNDRDDVRAEGVDSAGPVVDLSVPDLSVTEAEKHTGPKPSSPAVVSRPKRLVKMPEKLKDYHM